MSQRLDLVIESLEPRYVRAIEAIVRGLPEWFTREALEEILADCIRLTGFTAVANGGLWVSLYSRNGIAVSR